MGWGIVGDVVGGTVGAVGGLLGKGVGGATDYLGGGGESSVAPATVDEQYLEEQRRLEAESRAGMAKSEQDYADFLAGKGGPSVAESQLREAQNAAIAAQYAQARSATGSGAARGAAGYNAARNSAGIMQDTAASAATLRAQEQDAARRGLADIRGQQRAADQSMFAGEGNWQGTAAGVQGQNAQTSLGAQEQYASRRQQGIGSLMSAAGGIGAAALSDERMKDDMGPIPGDDIDAFLEAAAGHRYRYRAESGEDPDVEREGVMAQDLERTRMGDALVDDGPDGVKRIDTRMGYGAMLAAMHDMHERLRGLEGKGGK